MSAIQCTGVLGRDAEARTGTDGTAWVCIEVHQVSGSIAATARLRVGQGPASIFVANHSARRLRAGVRVTVHAAGFDIAHSPTPHLVLTGVDFIEHLAAAPPQHVRDAGELPLNAHH